MKQLEDFILEVKETIISVANFQNMTPDQIENEDSFFAGGVGLDSIDLLELIVVIEKKFGLKIQNDEYGREYLKSPLSLATAVFNHVSKV